MNIWFCVDGEDYLLVAGIDYTVSGNTATLSEKRRKQLQEWKKQHKSVGICTAYTSDTPLAWNIQVEASE